MLLLTEYAEFFDTDQAKDGVEHKIVFVVENSLYSKILLIDGISL